MSLVKDRQILFNVRMFVNHRDSVMKWLSGMGSLANWDGLTKVIDQVRITMSVRNTKKNKGEKGKP